MHKGSLPLVPGLLSFVSILQTVDGEKIGKVGMRALLDAQVGKFRSDTLDTLWEMWNVHADGGHDQPVLDCGLCKCSTLARHVLECIGRKPEEMDHIVFTVRANLLGPQMHELPDLMNCTVDRTKPPRIIYWKEKHAGSLPCKMATRLMEVTLACRRALWSTWRKLKIKGQVCKNRLGGLASAGTANASAWFSIIRKFRQSSKAPIRVKHPSPGECDHSRSLVLLVPSHRLANRRGLGMPHTAGMGHLDPRAMEPAAHADFAKSRKLPHKELALEDLQFNTTPMLSTAKEPSCVADSKASSPSEVTTVKEALSATASKAFSTPAKPPAKLMLRVPVFLSGDAVPDECPSRRIIAILKLAAEFKRRLTKWQSAANVKTNNGMHSLTAYRVPAISRWLNISTPTGIDALIMVLDGHIKLSQYLSASTQPLTSEWVDTRIPLPLLNDMLARKLSAVTSTRDWEAHVLSPADLLAELNELKSPREGGSGCVLDRRSSSTADPPRASGAGSGLVHVKAPTRVGTLHAVVFNPAGISAQVSVQTLAPATDIKRVDILATPDEGLTEHLATFGNEVHLLQVEWLIQDSQHVCRIATKTYVPAVEMIVSEAFTTPCIVRSVVL